MSANQTADQPFSRWTWSMCKAYFRCPGPALPKDSQQSIDEDNVIARFQELVFEAKKPLTSKGTLSRKWYTRFTTHDAEHWTLTMTALFLSLPEHIRHNIPVRVTGEKAQAFVERHLRALQTDKPAPEQVKSKESSCPYQGLCLNAIDWDKTSCVLYLSLPQTIRVHFPVKFILKYTGKDRKTCNLVDLN